MVRSSGGLRVDDPYAVDRRAFLKTGATAVAATAVACGSPTSPWRALSEGEARTLGAACDCIIPPDEDPGAVEAGTVAFIDRQLATRQGKALGDWQAGLGALDAASRSLHGRPFAEMSFEARTALLADVEKGRGGEGDWGDLDPARFFRLLRDHTMMGFYGDPRHGGNRDRVAWRMLGVPDPPIRGRLHATTTGSAKRKG
jgi:gluconate 2-dehydrogenase gamma chain